jgi:hypothetical protein
MVLIKPIEIEGIHLTKEDGKIVVEVQVEGLWYPVIRDGHENPDHFLSSRGIEHEIFRINMDLVKDEVLDVEDLTTDYLQEGNG